VLPLYFLTFVLACAAVVAFRRRPAAAGALYRLALMLAALPYLLHAWYLWGWISGFGDPAPRIGVYPGLVAFLAAAAIGTTTLLLLAWITVSRMPLAAAAMPPALWLLYWFAVIPLAYWRAPAFVPIDNKPLIWLFAFSAFATLTLAITGWVAFPRRGSHHA
jgi:hypothetical protein